MTRKENAAQAGQGGGKGKAEIFNSVDYSDFIAQVAGFVQQRNDVGGYRFADAMQVAKRYGLKQDDAATFMRENGRFCFDVATCNLHLSRGAKI